VEHDLTGLELARFFFREAVAPIIGHVMPGLRYSAPIGPAIWTRDRWFLGMDRWGGQTERIHLVRLGSPGGEIAPMMSAAQLADECITAQRWWTLDELEAAANLEFAPRHLPALLSELVRRGQPAAPVDVGV
jgi:hypothetical protein